MSKISGSEFSSTKTSYLSFVRLEAAGVTVDSKLRLFLVMMSSGYNLYFVDFLRQILLKKVGGENAISKSKFTRKKLLIRQTIMTGKG